ncbi:MAG TPA: hypothetical protein VGD99_04625 [Anaerolineae bacterium]|jgi:hypothetical protein
MDLLKKVETLINAAARSKLPRRQRHSILDEQDEELLAKIRQALANVQAQEQVLYGRLKSEQEQAKEAAQQGDQDNQRAHERRAFELERRLEQEGIEAINLEEKLAALEEKLALAKAAVDKEAQAAALREQEADKILAGIDNPETGRPSTLPVQKETPADDDAELESRKSRLSD